MVKVAARPETFQFETAHAAVIVVDMQNDFGSEGGMFERAAVPISDIQAVVPPVKRVLAACRRAGIPVVYLKMEFEPDLTDAGGPDAPNRVFHRRLGVGDPVSSPDGSESRILVKDTWNTAIIPELAPEEGDVVISKHRFSGFFETQLDELLQERGATSLIFTGCTTSVCVESTLRDAFFRDYRCLLLEDCTAEPIGSQFPRTNHEASVLTIETLFGWVSNSDALEVSLTEEHASVGVPTS